MPQETKSWALPVAVGHDASAPSCTVHSGSSGANVHVPPPGPVSVRLTPWVAPASAAAAHLRNAGHHPLEDRGHRVGVARQFGGAPHGSADVVAEVAVVVEHEGVGEQVQRVGAEVAEGHDGVTEARLLQRSHRSEAGDRPGVVLGRDLGR